MGKRDQENRPKAKTYKTERVTGQEPHKRGDIYIEKWDQTGNPEIATDRGEDIRNAPVSLGGPMS